MAPLGRHRAAGEDFGTAAFTATDAFASAVLGSFDAEHRYVDIPVDERVEVLTVSSPWPAISSARARSAGSAHVILGRRDDAMRGGHLLRAIARLTRSWSPDPPAG